MSKPIKFPRWSRIQIEDGLILLLVPLCSASCIASYLAIIFNMKPGEHFRFSLVFSSEKPRPMG